MHLRIEVETIGNAFRVRISGADQNWYLAGFYVTREAAETVALGLRRHLYAWKREKVYG